jgi:dCTP deaminase
MSILSGPKIEWMVAWTREFRERRGQDAECIARQLDIEPFDPAHCGPNSYDLTLAPELVCYDVQAALGQCLDARADNPTFRFAIPPEGYVLQPGRLYLAATVERTECHGLVPVLNGRSSVGRLGVSVHVTAGFGDDGFAGRWTLEITAVHPVRVYAGMRIAQVAFFALEGGRKPYAGKYQGQRAPVASRAFMDQEVGGGE